MNIPDIITRLVAIYGDKQAELASDLKVSQPTVSRWISGSDSRGATRDRIVALARRKGILPADRQNSSRSADPTVFSTVPVLSWVSAGKLIEPATPIPVDDQTKTLFVANLPSGEYFGLQVSGTSMDRYSPDKSVIIVNVRERVPHEGQPYVFCVKGEVTYKLWGSHPPRLEPYSTDPSNKPIFLDRRQRVDVIGRVRRSILDL